VPALAHTHHDHAAAAAQDGQNRVSKFRPDALAQAQHRSRFYLKGLAGQGHCLRWVKSGAIDCHALDSIEPQRSILEFETATALNPLLRQGFPAGET
jgi:hypothetical protein